MASNKGTGFFVFRNRDFRAFLAARALASLSSLMLGVAVGWHVYDLMGSALALGLVGLAQFIPALLLSLPGGLVADRFERRTILLICFTLEIVVALLLLCVSLISGARAGWIFPIVALIGASNQLGEFESGATAAWLGTVPAVVLGGVGTLVVVLIWALIFPTLRRADRLDAVPNAAPPGDAAGV